jgi:hypothetical protein
MRRLYRYGDECSAVITSNYEKRRSSRLPIWHHDVFVVKDLQYPTGSQPVTGDFILVLVIEQEGSDAGT